MPTCMWKTARMMTLGYVLCKVDTEAQQDCKEYDADKHDEDNLMYINLYVDEVLVKDEYKENENYRIELEEIGIRSE